MNVETYEVEATHPEVDEAANALIEQLGLEGQKAYTNPETGARCPYRTMTDDETFVYGILCSVKAPAHKFDAEPMPLRVLQVLAHAKDIGVFEGYEVWHPARPMKDPVLVAWMPGEQYRTTRYMLARWGAELDSFPTLMDKALRQHRDNTIAALTKIKSEAESRLASVLGTSDAGLASLRSVSAPAVYWS